MSQLSYVHPLRNELAKALFRGHPAVILVLNRHKPASAKKRKKERVQDDRMIEAIILLVVIDFRMIDFYRPKDFWD